MKVATYSTRLIHRLTSVLFSLPHRCVFVTTSNLYAKTGFLFCTCQIGKIVSYLQNLPGLICFPNHRLLFNEMKSTNYKNRNYSKQTPRFLMQQPFTANHAADVPVIWAAAIIQKRIELLSSVFADVFPIKPLD